MKNNTEAKFSVINVKKKEHAYPSYHPRSINSCQDLMETLVNVAKSNPEEVIYVCEDDYLHTSYAITAMKKLFTTGYNGFYLPYDYPDNYIHIYNNTTALFVGEYGHLRTVNSATLTIAAKGSTWLLYTYDLLRAGVFSDDTWTWKAFREVRAVCPVPGHATHLQDHCITPGIAWEQIMQSILIED